MVIDKNDSFHIIAEEGKVFKRKSDGLIFGEEIFLGYTYYNKGKKLDEPHLEVPEDFEEAVTFLKAAGIGKNAPVNRREDGYCTFFFTDPEGNVVHLAKWADDRGMFR